MDQELRSRNTRLDNLTSFLRKTMLTRQDLKDLRAELLTRSDFAELQASVDVKAKRFKDIDQELRVTAARTTRM